MSAIVPDIWNATVKSRRNELARARHGAEMNLAALPHKNSSYALTIAAWLTVLKEESAAFEAAVARLTPSNMTEPAP